MATQWVLTLTLIALFCAALNHRVTHAISSSSPSPLTSSPESSESPQFQQPPTFTTTIDQKFEIPPPPPINDPKNVTKSLRKSTVETPVSTTTTTISTSTSITPNTSTINLGTESTPSAKSLNLGDDHHFDDHHHEEKLHKSQFKWNSMQIISGQQNSLSYKLNCTPDYMTIEVNLTGFGDPFVYLEKLKTFSICRPKIVKSIATFHLALDDNFYRCGTTKVHDQVSGTRIYYNRVIVESKKHKEPKSVYFKCSLPSISKILGKSLRSKRQLLPSGPGKLVNFTEIDLPDNFMEAEILDFDQNITQRAPYPHLGIRVKRNGQLVNTSLNVAPGTPLEMIIYLDDESKHVYGLLASFMKVTDNSARPKEETIVLNGCSIDPYIFGNFETEDAGDSVSAKFRAFKFPESSYVMFVGTVNVCLDQCKGVPCGNDITAFGRRRRKRSIPTDIPRDPNKVFEIEMITYLKIGYSEENLKKSTNALEGSFESEPKSSSRSYKPSKLTISQNESTNQHKAQPVTSKWFESNSSTLNSGPLSITTFISFITILFWIIHH